MGRRQFQPLGAGCAPPACWAGGRPLTQGGAGPDPGPEAQAMPQSFLLTCDAEGGHAQGEHEEGSGLAGHFDGGGFRAESGGGLWKACRKL